MNKKMIALLVSGTFLLSSVGVAAEKSSKRKKDIDIPVVTAQVPKKVVKPWEPAAFNQDVDRLPSNYLGLDPIKFLKIFKSKVNNLKKGEFETSEEFAQRTANKDALLAPINTRDLYAFRIRDISIEYDADAQTYLIGDRYDCEETYPFGESKDWVVCKVASISLS